MADRSELVKHCLKLIVGSAGTGGILAAGDVPVEHITYAAIVAGAGGVLLTIPRLIEAAKTWFQGRADIARINAQRIADVALIEAKARVDLARLAQEKGAIDAAVIKANSDRLAAIEAERQAEKDRRADERELVSTDLNQKQAEIESLRATVKALKDGQRTNGAAIQQAATPAGVDVQVAAVPEGTDDLPAQP